MAKKTGMRIVTVSQLPDCDVCKLEFPSSIPNPARYDGPVDGPQWGYMCEAHKRVVKGLTIRLETRDTPKGTL